MSDEDWEKCGPYYLQNYENFMYLKYVLGTKNIANELWKKRGDCGFLTSFKRRLSGDRAEDHGNKVRRSVTTIGFPESDREERCLSLHSSQGVANELLKRQVLSIFMVFDLDRVVLFGMFCNYSFFLGDFDKLCL